MAQAGGEPVGTEMALGDLVFCVVAGHIEGAGGDAELAADAFYIRGD